MVVNPGVTRVSKILIYAMNYAPEIAGVGRFTGEIGAHLADLGHEVTVVTTPPHYPGWKLQAPYRALRWSREKAGRVSVIRCPLLMREKIGGVWRLIAPLTFAISSAPVVLVCALMWRPDVILCIEPTLLGAPAALLGGALVGAERVLHVQDLEVDASFAVGHLRSITALKALAFAFEKFCLRRFDRIITISHKMAARLVDKRVEPAKLAIVRNWVDLDRIRPLNGPSPYRRELGFAETDRVVLYSGNLGLKQDFDTLLRTIESLAGDASIKFVIAGEGPAKANLERHAGRLPNLQLLPFQADERLGAFLGMADAHLLPQAKDAADLVLPSKLGGLLASGRPIVVTTSTHTELANFLGDAVCYAPPDDASRLAAAILTALQEGANEAKRVERLRLAGLLSRRDRLRDLAEIMGGSRKGQALWLDGEPAKAAGKSAGGA